MIVTLGGEPWDVTEPPAAVPFWPHFQSGEWEPDTREIIDRYVTPGSTFVDIGAWIGPLSLWAARLGARVVAVEPDGLAYSHLLLNSWGRNIDCLQAAIWRHSGVCTLAAHSAGWGSSMSYVGNGEQTSIVPCWTLPDLWDALPIENVSLVKMDIEGAEAAILDKVAPFLAERDIPFLLSMHEDLAPVLGSMPGWFKGFSKIEGEFATFGSLLAVP